MKNFKLNDLSKKVLAAFIWLLTFAVVTTTASIGGTGWFGTLTFYTGALFLVFVLFDDEYLKKQTKNALFIVVIFSAASLFIGFLDKLFDVLNVVEFTNASYYVKNVDVNGVVTKTVSVKEIHTLPYLFLDIMSMLISYARAFVLVVALIMVLTSKIKKDSNTNEVSNINEVNE